MFAYLFTILLCIANIYFFVKKKYVYLFIPCMLFLPQYYGIDFPEPFPLVTFTRIMYLIFYLYVFINHRRTLCVSKPYFKSLSLEYKLILAYFILRLISNLYYVNSCNQAIKTIFEILFEQLLFLLAFYMLDLTSEEIHKLINIVLSIATLFFIIGILESLIGIRPFDVLYTVYRGVINEHYLRMGLLRSTTTFGMPGMFANMCVLMLPLIFYMYRLTHHKRFLISIGLDILAIIHSGSRADMLYIFMILALYFIFVLTDKQQRISFIRNSFFVLASLLIFISIASISSPHYRYFYLTSGKSVLNEVGFEFDLSEDSPSSSVDYGVNSVRGSVTRTSQLTALNYVFHNNPLFGMGAGSQLRDVVMYHWYGKWRPLNSYDMGIVEIFCDEGFIGLLGMISLIISLLLSSRKRISFLMCITYLLTTLNTVNMFSFLLFYTVIILTLYTRKTEAD